MPSAEETLSYFNEGPRDILTCSIQLFDAIGVAHGADIISTEKIHVSAGQAACVINPAQIHFWQLVPSIL